jgi:hypothetical protein
MSVASSTTRRALSRHVGCWPAGVSSVVVDALPSLSIAA